MVHVKRKDGPETEEQKQKHRAPSEGISAPLFASPSILSDPFSPVPRRHSSRSIAEASTPGYYSTTKSTPLDRQSQWWLMTPHSSGSNILHPSTVNSPTLGCDSHLAYFPFESAQEQTKIMEETFHHHNTPASYHSYSPGNFIPHAPYSGTSYSSFQEPEACIIPADGVETSQSQFPFDVPYIPSPCYHCNDVLYHTLNDWYVHLWKAHEDPSSWTTTTCVWEGCKTASAFTSVKLWLDHVRIVHHKSFYCKRADCKIRLGGPNAKPFGSKADLRRHNLSTHATPIYCDKLGCTGKEKLNRADKRSKHKFNYHGQRLCTVDECPRSRHVGSVYYGFSTQDDLDAHLRDKHRVQAINGSVL
ncbi:hypothetical protein EG329_013125 [Mollisiaceae sp. DMI_Dod_QoI]|nr:hypothetical protein EG329_013125 [Helotiales sp. DMI_Dod_QoI]